MTEVIYENQNLQQKENVSTKRNKFGGFVGGGIIGVLGGLIGLGGAEFRLPLLISTFKFNALESVVMNKAMSLIVVASALPFRAGTIPFASLLANWQIVVNLLAGSILGAWGGASIAVKIESKSLYRIISILLFFIALIMLFGHHIMNHGTALFSGIPLVMVGIIVGYGIGIVASLLGVAGGELLIPTLVLLFNLDIKLAGSLSLVISLPTMLTAFTRYSKDKSFAVLDKHREFLFVMAFGSLIGTFIGGRLLGVVPGELIMPLLAILLILSSIKIWRHRMK